jgi:toxin ParE1/3/4
MRRIVRSHQARLDLSEIWYFIAADSVEAADRWIDLLDQKMRPYAENPRLGTRREDLAEGLRSFPVGNYVVFYREVRGGIGIARVLHGARRIVSSAFGPLTDTETD